MKKRFFVLSLILVLFVACATLAACGEKEKFDVHFRLDGGEATFELSQVIEDGKTASKPTPDPTKEDYEFKWWSVVGDDEKAEFKFSTPITEETFLIAIWIKQTVTVTFYTNDDTAVDWQVINKGGIATAAAEPAKLGYIFAHWALKGDTTETEFNFSAAINENISLIAVWNIGTLTVTFDSDGGGDIAPQTVTTLTCANEPAEPAKAGYTFIFWAIKGDATETEYNFATPVSDNLELVAIWEYIETYAIENIVGTYKAENCYLTIAADGTGTLAGGNSDYNVTFNIKNGILAAKPSSGNDITFSYDAPYKVFTITSNNFQGYQKGMAFAFQVTVSFEEGLGSYAAQVIDYNALATKPETDPSREGYHFEYWASSELLSSPFAWTLAVTKDVHLVAIWREVVDLTEVAGVWTGRYDVTYDWIITIGANESISLIRRQVSNGNITNNVVSRISYSNSLLSFYFGGAEYRLELNSEKNKLTNRLGSSLPTQFVLASDGLQHEGTGNDFAEIAGDWNAEVRLQPGKFSLWTLTIDSSEETVFIKFVRASDGNITEVFATNAKYENHILTFKAIITGIKATAIDFAIEFFGEDAMSLLFADSHLSSSTMFVLGEIPAPTGWELIAGTWRLIDTLGSRTWIMIITKDGQVTLTPNVGFTSMSALSNISFGEWGEGDARGYYLYFNVTLQYDYGPVYFRMKLDGLKIKITASDNRQQCLGVGTEFTQV